ncbi:hypothetical protein AXFE_29030 [Acidithrix ferrooxidans]|uniref:Uncharacterized protein n=1 Tax=Acidithrix ferrooxidans TaxID=1280514 RepID=A0A0D8HEA3_9ACTN|nr:hypothetical protein AXFE_29030 [Acidithrix ferrooxidans]
MSGMNVGLCLVTISFSNSKGPQIEVFMAIVR